MGTIITYALIAGLLSGILTVVASHKQGGKAIGWGVFSTIAGATMEFCFLYFLMPSFAHWTSGGLFWSMVLVGFGSLACGWFATFSGDESETDAPTVTTIGAIVLVLLTLVIGVFVNPPAWMNNQFWDRVADLANVREATQGHMEEAASDDDLLKVSPAQANLEARGEMPGDIGSYAAVGSTFEQTVAGQQVYVTDLTVTNWAGYRSEGGALPGYFIRPAKDIDAPTNFVSGYMMKYAREAQWDMDIDRHVYLEYTLLCGCVIDALDVLEIDDEGNPKYTATVWQYVEGSVGSIATKVLVIDPSNGQIDEYGIADAPEWIDRIYSMEKILERAQWWAEYSMWDAQLFIDNSSGRMRVDAIEDVYGADGKLEYMVTITSSGSDQTLLYDLRVDPRTGEMIKYTATGKTLQAIDDMIDESTYTPEINTANGAEPIECERQMLLGEMTYYCLLESRGSGEGSFGANVGYAFLKERYTAASNRVIVANNFADAWTALRRQTTEGGGDAQVQATEANLIVVTGVLAVKADASTDGMVWFVVTNDQYPAGLYFRVSDTNPVIALAKEGHQVEVTAFDLTVDHVNDVVTLVNRTLPPLTPQP